MTKHIFKKFWDEFVYGGHLIALGATGICLMFIIFINEKISIYPLISVYILTLTLLLYNRYKEKKTDYLTNFQRTKFLEKYFKNILLIIFLTLIIILIFFLIENINKAFIFLILLAIIMYLYTKYLKNLSNKIFCLKNIIFSLIFTSLLLFISFYYSYNLLNPIFFLIFAFCFLRMLTNTIFLDIKDIESDMKNNLKTFPIIFGTKKTIFFLKIITLISGLLITFGVILKIIPIYSLMLLFVIPYTFYYFKKSEKKENFYLVNYVLADAEFILWPISIVIGKTILL